MLIARRRMLVVPPLLPLLRLASGPPLGWAGGAPGGGCGPGPLPLVSPGGGDPVGAGGDAQAMMDDDNDVVPDQVQHPATRYTIHLMAARLRTTLFVCEHAGLDSLRSEVAS